jgi:hypothetical protein
VGFVVGEGQSMTPGQIIPEIYSQFLHTTDGGTTWNSIRWFNQPQLYGVSFIDENNGIFVGRNGRLSRTTDGGITWTGQTSGTTNNLLGVAFTSLNTATAVGLNGTILHTTNGGAEWVSQPSGTTKNLLAVSFSSPNTGTIVGADGIILRTTTGGTTDVNDLMNQVPNRFALEQNYPNPFNPSTTIKYDLPKTSYVKLIMFDALGKQVRTLVNEEKSAGSYIVELNASNLPSGVYFYRIQTGDFIQTKKLILMR